MGATSGIATSWTATPGPVMALGLIMAGSLAAYCIALGLLGRTVWSAIATAPQTVPLVAATVIGSLFGLLIGPRLPSPVVVPAIRLFSAVAGFVLLARAITSRCRNSSGVGQRR